MDLKKLPELSTEILDILPNAVFVKDSNLRYVWVNASFEKLLGVSSKDIVGHHGAEVFRTRDEARGLSEDLRILESGGVEESSETVIMATDGQRETMTRKTLLTSNANGKFLVGVIQDADLAKVERRREESENLSGERARALERVSNTDPLTRCLNRRALLVVAQDCLVGSTDGALLMLGLDRFKAINDTHGHDGGDLALRHFAALVRGVIRDNDRLARMGGEEFAVVLPDTPRADAVGIAERIRRAVEGTAVNFQGTDIRMTVSIGVVQRGVDNNANLDEWLADSDDCLYQAKEQGRNRVVVELA